GGTAPRAVFRYVAFARCGAAHGARGLEGVSRAVVARAVAGFGHVADARRGSADGARRALAVGRAGRAGAGTGLGRVAGTRRGAAGRAGVASGMLASRSGPVALVERARIAVVSAGRGSRLHRIRRAGGAGSGAERLHVALAGRRAAHNARRLESIGRALVARALASLGDLADARGGAADGAGSALRVGGTGGAGACTGLG